MNGLKSLEKLWLNNNKIEVFRYLEKLPSIRNINIRNNRISQLYGLETIDSFVDIDLSNNHLSEPLIKTIKDIKKRKKNYNWFVIYYLNLAATVFLPKVIVISITLKKKFLF